MTKETITLVKVRCMSIEQAKENLAQIGRFYQMHEPKEVETLKAITKYLDTLNKLCGKYAEFVDGTRCDLVFLGDVIGVLREVDG